MKKPVLFILIPALLVVFYLFRPFSEHKRISYGVTFSSIFSRQLGLDWQKNFLAVLDDLKIKKLRLMAYWPEIEAKEGKYDFADLDWQIKEAEKRNVEIILAVGQKLPRWPECHIPEWASSFFKDKREQKIKDLIEMVIKRYKDRKAIKIWQVENEPFLSFGECLKLNKEFLDKEIGFVRDLDPLRPILLTDSGELGLWLPAVKRGDIFGTTMYFQIYHDFFGQFRWPTFPGFFRFKSRLTDLLAGPKPKIIIEFQMEPWGEKQIYQMPLESQLKIFNIDQFDPRIEFIKKTGFSEVYLWGAEWWYWLKEKQNRPEFWDKAKELLADEPQGVKK